MLLSDSYKRLLEQDHEKSPNWGTTGAKFKEQVEQLCRTFKTHDVLDYGCGKGRLADALGFDVARYDPGIPEHAGDPGPHDIVISTDVLEHVEPACVDSVCGHLFSLTKVAGFHAISTCKAAHILPNGRNAHLTVRGPDFWRDKLESAGFIVDDVRLTAFHPRYEAVCYTCFVYRKHWMGV